MQDREGWAAGAKVLSDETAVVLYALKEQATKGPAGARPRSWTFASIDTTRWQAHAQLGQMSSMEAMRLYVRVLEDEQAGLPVPPSCMSIGRILPLACSSLLHVVRQSSLSCMSMRRTLKSLVDGAALEMVGRHVSGARAGERGGHYGR